MKKDAKDSWQPMMKRRMMRSFQGRCLGEISDSKREKEKENQGTNGAVTNEVASKTWLRREGERTIHTNSEARPLRIAGKTTPMSAAPKPAEHMFVEDMTSVPEEAHWNCVRKGKIGKIHVLEILAGSARFSQCCALTGLKVGAPVDIRNVRANV